MMRYAGSAILVMLVLVVGLIAQEPILKGKLKAIDAEKGVITVTLPDGKDRALISSSSTRFMGADGNALRDGLKSGVFRTGDMVMFKAASKDGQDYLVGLRAIGGVQETPKVNVSNLKPLTELGDSDYQGHKGGLYPGGKNERPAEHENAGLQLAKLIQPLNSAGAPSKDGRIVLLSVGMSNTSQASQGFQKALAKEKNKNPQLVFVNGAQGGMTAARVQDPNDNASGGAKYWATVDERLKSAGVSRAQVQVIWIKQADAGPKQGFPKYAKTLQAELARIVQLFPERFPAVKLVYLSSRTYGGYATTGLNPEPYAFESGLSVKWLIEDQTSGKQELNYDAAKGPIRAPWLSWGPYLWASGTTKRADGFYYEPADFTPNDGTHLSPSGMDKVGNLMLQFFKTDSTTKGWFLAP